MMENIFAGILIVAVIAVTAAVWVFDTIGAKEQKGSK